MLVGDHVLWKIGEVADLLSLGGNGGFPLAHAGLEHQADRPAAVPGRVHGRVLDVAQVRAYLDIHGEFEPGDPPHGVCQGLTEIDSAARQVPLTSARLDSAASEQDSRGCRNEDFYAQPGNLAINVVELFQRQGGIFCPHDRML